MTVEIANVSYFNNEFLVVNLLELMNSVIIRELSLYGLSLLPHLFVHSDAVDMKEVSISGNVTTGRVLMIHNRRDWRSVMY